MQKRFLLLLVGLVLPGSVWATGFVDDMPCARGAMFGSLRSPGSSFSWVEPAAVAAPIGSKTDPRMLNAAQIAERRAERHSVRLCWRYVKTALVQAGAVGSYPRSNYAKQAGAELTGSHGFTKLAIRNPLRAPVGSVLVYGGPGAGHVEIRTRSGFVSDYKSRWPANLPLLGVYAKAA